MIYPTIDPHRRFWSFVDKTEDCWIWTGGKFRHGYGMFTLHPHHSVSAHRWSYEQWHGTIPAGLVIDHLCRNPPCVNPAHLEAVTQQTNVLRGAGPSAKNARKTHCKRGHKYIPETTLITSTGERRCRPCGALSKRRSRARRLAPEN